MYGVCLDQHVLQNLAALAVAGSNRCFGQLRRIGRLDASRLYERARCLNRLNGNSPRSGVIISSYHHARHHDIMDC